MHLALAEELVTAKARLQDGGSWQEQWKKAFANSFLKVDSEIGGALGGEPVAPETAGSTAVVAIISPTLIIVANCGDSRAVLCRGKVPMPLSVDHKVGTNAPPPPPPETSQSYCSIIVLT